MIPVKFNARAFVTEGSLSEVVVKVIDETVIELLEGLGFVVLNKEQNIMSLIAPDQSFKVKLFEKLRDEGICFSAGHDWCPADVFEFLRDQKMLNGVYRKIVWDGPKKPRVIENC